MGLGSALGIPVAVWIVLVCLLILADVAIMVCCFLALKKRRESKSGTAIADMREAPACEGPSVDASSIHAESWQMSPRAVPHQCRSPPAVQFRKIPPGMGSPKSSHPPPSVPVKSFRSPSAASHHLQSPMSVAEEVQISKAAGQPAGLAVDSALHLRDATGPSAGLERLRGWCITHVNGQEVTDTVQLFAAADASDGPVLRLAPPRAAPSTLPSKSSAPPPPRVPADSTAARAAAPPAPNDLIVPQAQGTAQPLPRRRERIESVRAVVSPGEAVVLRPVTVRQGEGSYTPLTAAEPLPHGAIVTVHSVRGIRALVTHEVSGVRGWVTTVGDDACPLLAATTGGGSLVVTESPARSARPRAKVPCGRPPPPADRDTTPTSTIVVGRDCDDSADYFHPQQPGAPRRRVPAPQPDSDVVVVEEELRPASPVSCASPKRSAPPGSQPRSPVAVVVASVPSSPVWGSRGRVTERGGGLSPMPPDVTSAVSTPRPPHTTSHLTSPARAVHLDETPDAHWWLTPQRAASAVRRGSQPPPSPPMFVEVPSPPQPQSRGYSPPHLPRSAPDMSQLSKLTPSSVNPLQEFESELRRADAVQQRRYASELEASGVGGMPRSGRQPLPENTRHVDPSFRSTGDTFYVTPSAASQQGDVWPARHGSRGRRP